MEITMAEYQNYAEAVEDEDFKEFVKQNYLFPLLLNLSRIFLFH